MDLKQQEKEAFNYICNCLNLDALGKAIALNVIQALMIKYEWRKK